MLLDHEAELPTTTKYVYSSLISRSIPFWNRRKVAVVDPGCMVLNIRVTRPATVRLRRSPIQWVPYGCLGPFFTGV